MSPLNTFESSAYDEGDTRQRRLTTFQAWHMRLQSTIILQILGVLSVLLIFLHQILLGQYYATNQTKIAHIVQKLMEQIGTNLNDTSEEEFADYGNIEYASST